MHTLDILYTNCCNGFVSEYSQHLLTVVALAAEATQINECLYRTVD